MKKLIFGILLSLVTIGCDKDDDTAGERVIVEDVTLRNSQTFSYNLGYFGIEEGASVQKQPENAEVSKIVRSEESGELSYHYKAEENFKGKDYVEIYTERGSDGVNPGTSKEFIKITFTVTE